jgi:hypothetical protein
MGLQGTSMPVAGGGYVTTVYCQNSYAWRRLLDAIATINPDAGAPVPVPHDLAAAMLRDGVVAAPTIEPLDHHAHEAPMPPFDPLQDDDEGGPAEAPRCSTGGCGED